jgi:hypothetical protein
MQHHLKVSHKEFDALKNKKRHIITKPGDHQIGDTLVLTQDGTREQLTFSILGVEPLHQRSVVLALFAPYVPVDLTLGKVTENDLPETVGGGPGIAGKDEVDY